MAKVRCPKCGAKTPEDQRRCRVCQTILNPDAPQYELKKLGPKKDDGDKASAERAGDEADAAGFPPLPQREVEEEPEPDAVPSEPSTDAESFDPSELVVDRSQRAPADPLVDETEEHFDPEALEIDEPADPRPTSDS